MSFSVAGFLVSLIFVTHKRWITSRDDRDSQEELHLDSLLQRPHQIHQAAHTFQHCHVNFVNLKDKLLGEKTNTSESRLCVLTKTEPAFHVCTYPTDKDIYISSALQTDGIWEPYITPVFQAALRGCAECVLIDVGANVGYYSLLAATMGHLVLAVEPNSESLLRLNMGVKLNQLQLRVRPIRNAVYDFRTNATLTNNPDNQGGVWIKSIIPKSKGSSLHNESTVETITLDHLLVISYLRKAIIKLDIGKLIQ